ncbi:MAG TPA: sulfur carrier protein ThiS [Candidatus Brachybacterium merdavium]|uniref:Sulfur carrier protein ThiS n=1 Tax=Candidatus Brachybacterium merdavium TaxID=2838513 RepID=A0A9D2LCU6_9MICO|nr:sulfur carrier protein ThiS [Candidatus Brachybacterium merdavium]
MTISLTLNGEAIDVPESWTVRELVSDRLGHEIGEDGRALDGSPLGVAVALDDTVIPRGRWATTALPPRGRCEFVTAVQGG